MTATILPRGRPRSHEADVAIAEATLDLLIEHGYEGTSMQAIAQRIGVRGWQIQRVDAGPSRAVGRQVQCRAPVKSADFKNQRKSSVGSQRFNHLDHSMFKNQIIKRILPRPMDPRM